MTVSPFEYFDESDLPKLNSLLHNFPDFEPSEFSAYINDGSNANLIHYYFYTVYKMMLDTGEDNYKDSKVKMQNLLNLTENRSLINLWIEFCKSIIASPKKDSFKVNYFRLLDEKKVNGSLDEF